jgi:hypothetical protein
VSKVTKQEFIAMAALVGLGFLLLFIATFVDPIGASPDTGVIDLGPTGTKWLLGTMGAVLLGYGIWICIKTAASRPRRRP